MKFESLRVALILMLFMSGTLKANYTLSYQFLASTANAGGQKASALRFAQDDRYEIYAFSNDYLTTKPYPLTGIGAGKRFALCQGYCLFKPFFQLEAGLSTAGPFLASTWSLNLFWLVRIDFSTHAYFGYSRINLWSYPLWLGLSLPL